MARKVEKIVSVKELFQSELDAINNYIVIMEDRKDLSDDDKTTLEELRIVAQYLSDRIEGDVMIENTNHTIH
tara:strand:- start:9 stop:224 length:216 start_codon:yes stop_codon:yes gene_type:complete